MISLKLLGAAVALALSTQALAVGSLADVNVFDRRENRRLPVVWHEGRAYVVGKPGNEYQVTVRNRQGAEVLAVMSVDGVNVVTGETAHPLQSGYVLGPWGGVDIKGWRKNLSRTAAFYFIELADSYAARTGRPEHVGVIGVALYRRKAEPPQVIGRQAPTPRAEASSREGAAVSSPITDVERVTMSRIFSPSNSANASTSARRPTRSRINSATRHTTIPPELVPTRTTSFKSS